MALSQTQIIIFAVVVMFCLSISSSAIAFFVFYDTQGPTLLSCCGFSQLRFLVVVVVCAPGTQLTTIDTEPEINKYKFLDCMKVHANNFVFVYTVFIFL
jgi:hypothetical protein